MARQVMTRGSSFGAWFKIYSSHAILLLNTRFYTFIWQDLFFKLSPTESFPPGTAKLRAFKTRIFFQNATFCKWLHVLLQSLLKSKAMEGEGLMFFICNIMKRTNKLLIIHKMRLITSFYLFNINVSWEYFFPSQLIPSVLEWERAEL